MTYVQLNAVCFSGLSTKGGKFLRAHLQSQLKLFTIKIDFVTPRLILKKHVRDVETLKASSAQTPRTQPFIEAGDRLCSANEFQRTEIFAYL